MVKIPHRDDPNDPYTDDEWNRLYRPTPADAAWPEAQVTDNPITHVLLGPTGAPIRTWRERPPIGYRSRRTTT